MKDPRKPSRLEALGEWLLSKVFTLPIIVVLIVIGIALFNPRPATPPVSNDPSGVWAGLVDDLPSGRLVECVFARDPSGSVAVTCDWQNAITRGRP